MFFEVKKSSFSSRFLRSPYHGFFPLGDAAFFGQIVPPSSMAEAAEHKTMPDICFV